MTSVTEAVKGWLEQSGAVSARLRPPETIIYIPRQRRARIRPFPQVPFRLLKPYRQRILPPRHSKQPLNQ